MAVDDTAASHPPALGGPPPAVPVRLPGLQPLRLLAHQPAFRRALPAIGGLAALALAGLAWWGLQRPDHAALFAGLADADKAAIAEALQGAGMDFKVDAATGSLTVPEDELHRARMLLAGQGLPKAAPAGDAVLQSLPMGSSRAVEGEALRAAREADLARTIEAIDAVRGARVHIAVPDPTPFVRDNAAPAASIMLRLEDGRALSAAQVRAVRHLAASSVAGLAADRVAIVDQSGALLSQDAAGADDRNFALRLRIEERYRQAIAALLTPMVGAGNFTSEVSADVDFSESQSTRETYPKDDRALRREEGNRVDRDGDAEAVGIPGALSNQPPRATEVAAAPGGAVTTPQSPAGAGRSEETYSRSFDVGREIAVTHQPTGQVRRLSVAVALRDGTKPRGKADLAAIEALVKGAVGFDAARGDTVALSSRPFVAAESVEPGWWQQPWFAATLRQGVALVVALLVLLFVGRPLMRMLKERANDPGIALERRLLDAARGGSLRAEAPVTLEMIEAAPSYEARAALVRNFVRQDAARAALVIQQLTREAVRD